MVTPKEINKIPISISVNLTKTQILAIKKTIGLTGRNSNEVILKALISNVSNKKLRLCH